MSKIQEYISFFDNINEGREWLWKKAAVGSVVAKNDEVLFGPTAGANPDNPLVREANLLVLSGRNELLARSWSTPDTIDSCINIPEAFTIGRPGTAFTVPAGTYLVVYRNGDDICITNGKHPNIMNHHKVLGNGRIIFPIEMDPYNRASGLLNFCTEVHGRWQAPFESMSRNLCFTIVVNKNKPSVQDKDAISATLVGVVNTLSQRDLEAETVKACAITMQLNPPDVKKYTGGYRSVRKLIHLAPVMSCGVMLMADTGERLFLRNRMYSALVRAKADMSPTNLLDVLYNCRSSSDMEEISTINSAYSAAVGVIDRLRRLITSELASMWITYKHYDNDQFQKAVSNHPIGAELVVLRNTHGKDIDVSKEVADIASKIPGSVLAVMARSRYMPVFEQICERFNGGDSLKG
jgi:hypothetical protein